MQCPSVAHRTEAGDAVSSLGEEFPKEQARCRELLGIYREIGAPGRFGALMIEDMLRRADDAAMSGDVVRMIGIYEEMRDTK
jgi:hypothetical protein